MKPKESQAPTANAKKKRCAKKNARKIKAQQSAKGLREINEHAAGIDVGAEEHYVAVSPQSVPDGQSAVRSFSAFTGGLDALVEWLKECGVTTVAMESTGVYWIPLSQKLAEAGIDYVLANASHVRNVPGRKTDVKDCQWLQELHSYGLVSGSFRPDDEICKLRSLQRHRGNMVSSASAEIQHMQKAAPRIFLAAFARFAAKLRHGEFFFPRKGIDNSPLARLNFAHVFSRCLKIPTSKKFS